MSERYDTLVYHHDKNRRLTKIEYKNREHKIVRVDHFFLHPGKQRCIYRYNDAGQHHGICQVWWDRHQLFPRVYSVYQNGELRHETTYYQNGCIKRQMYIQGTTRFESGFYSNNRRQYMKSWIFDSSSMTWLRDGVWTGWYMNGNTTYVETYDTDAIVLDKCKYWQVNGEERTERTLARKKAVISIKKKESESNFEFPEEEWDEIDKTEDILRDILGDPDSGSEKWDFGDVNLSDTSFTVSGIDFKEGEFWDGLKMKVI